MEHTLWCGLERAEKVSYGCTKYELRGVSLLDTRVLLGQPLDYRFVCVPILRVRSCTIGCASRGGCAAVLSFRCRCVAGRRALPHLAAVHAVLTDFCLQGPLSQKISAPRAQGEVAGAPKHGSNPGASGPAFAPVTPPGQDPRGGCTVARCRRGAGGHGGDRLKFGSIRCRWYCFWQLWQRCKLAPPLLRQAAKVVNPLHLLLPRRHTC